MIELLKKNILPLSLITFLFVYCVLQQFGADILCLTKGCKIYGGFSLLGLPFYVLGAFFFFMLGILKLVRPQLYSHLLLLGCIAELGFLTWQIVFMPCTSCLVVATGILLLLFLSKKNKQLLWLLCMLFSMITGQVLVELTKPIPIYGDPTTAEYEIYFSLTCPKCESAMQSVLKTEGMADKVVLYPVAKNEEDRNQFRKMYCGLSQGEDLAEALQSGWNLGQCKHSETMKQLSWFDDVKLYTTLLWNKAILISKGYNTVPILVSNKLLVVPEKKTSNLWGQFHQPEESAGCAMPADSNSGMTGCGL